MNSQLSRYHVLLTVGKSIGSDTVWNLTWKETAAGVPVSEPTMGNSPAHGPSIRH
jgi:hypothetical protein